MPDGLSLQDFVQFVREARLAVLATASPSGRSEAALMEVAVTDSAELIFDAPADARKLVHIRQNNSVAVVIGWNDRASLQVEGLARIVADRERAHYERLYLDQWPRARIASPSLEVVVVTPRWLRHYDAKVVPARLRPATWLDDTRDRSLVGQDLERGDRA